MPASIPLDGSALHRGATSAEAARAEWAGWALAARILAPFVPPEERLTALLRALLASREDAEASPARSEALSVVWDLALTAARFGALDPGDIAEGFSPFLMPPVRSQRLIALGVVAAPESVWQIRARGLGREERGQPPPESRITVKAADQREAERFGFGHWTCEKPILLLEERYSIAIPELRNAELDRVMYFALCRPEGAPQVFLLGQVQVPHAHLALRPRATPDGGRWFRIDANTHPDFCFPADVPLPPAARVESPRPACNVDIAALLVLFAKAIPSEGDPSRGVRPQGS